MHVTCIWWSAHNDGGSILSAKQMLRLGRLSLDCQFEIVFHGLFDDE